MSDHRLCVKYISTLISQLPEHPEIYAAGGYTGHGVAMGVKAGSLIADAIVDGKPLPEWAALSR
jgi:glycine/D-amino acid oxidase-like deaminating enzyme